MVSKGEKGNTEDESKDKVKQANDIYKSALILISRNNNDLLDEAANLLTDAITLKSNVPNYFYKRGECFFKLEQYQRALFDYSMAIRLSPSTTKYYEARGHCFHAINRLNDALKDFNDALDLDHSNDEYLFQRAVLLCELEKYSEAIQDFTKALDHKNNSLSSNSSSSNSSKIHYYRGICYRHLKLYPQSVEDLKKALSAEFQVVLTRSNLGKTYFEYQKYDLAKMEFAVAMELGSNAVDIKFLHSLCYYHIGEFKLAHDELTHIIQTFPPKAEYFYYRCLCYYNQREYVLAKRDVLSAINLDGNNYEYLYVSGLCKLALKSLGESIQSFNACLSLRGDHQPSKFYCGIIHKLNGKYQEAQRIFEELRKTKTSLYECGKLLMHQHKYHQAIEKFIEALKAETWEQIPTTNTHILSELCHSYYLLGNFEMASQSCQEAIKEAVQSIYTTLVTQPSGTTGAPSTGNGQAPASNGTNGGNGTEGGAAVEKTEGEIWNAKLQMVCSVAPNAAKENMSLLFLTKMIIEYRLDVKDLNAIEQSYTWALKFHSSSSYCYYFYSLILSQCQRKEEAYNLLTHYLTSITSDIKKDGVPLLFALRGMLCLEEKKYTYAVENIYNAIGYAAEKTTITTHFSSVTLPSEDVPDSYAPAVSPLPSQSYLYLHRTDIPRLSYLHEYNQYWNLYETNKSSSMPPIYFSKLLYHLGVCMANLQCYNEAVSFFDSCVASCCTWGFASVENSLLIETSQEQVENVYYKPFCPPHVFHERALSLIHVNQLENALADLLLVLEMQPNNSQVYFHRAFVYLALGRRVEAANDFEYSKMLDPNNLSYRINLRKSNQYAILHYKEHGNQNSVIENQINILQNIISRHKKFALST